MKQKTNFSGFTLIEVMLTIMIVSLTIGPLYALFTTVINSFTRRTRTYESLIVAYSDLLRASVQEGALEKQTPNLTIQKITPPGSLTSIETIQALQAVTNWKDQGVNRTGRLVMYINKESK